MSDRETRLIEFVIDTCFSIIKQKDDIPSHYMNVLLDYYYKHDKDDKYCKFINEILTYNKWVGTY
jgi:hypothetical protein